MGKTYETLTFVNVDQPGNPHDSSQTVVRRAAMKAFRRRQRLERIAAYKAEIDSQAEVDESPVQITSPRISKHSVPKATDKKAPGSPRINLKSTSPRSSGTGSISSVPDIVSEEAQSCEWGMIGPVVPSQVPSPRSLQSPDEYVTMGAPGLAYLFNYFVCTIVPIMLPLESLSGQMALRQFWSRELSKDPLILQAAASHAAVYIDLTTSNTPSNWSSSHTKQVMRSIRERLMAKPSSIENEVIEAVALLSANSNVNGDMRESQIHMDALKEMVRLRGGKDALGDDVGLHTVISWSDTNFARLSRSRPRFAPVSPLCLESTQISHKDETFGLIQELRDLAGIYETIDTDSSVTITEIMEFDARRNSLDERLVCLQHIFFTSPPLDFGSQFLEICLTASSIYMALAFRKLSPNFPLLRTLKKDIMAAFQKLENLYMSMGTLPENQTPYADMLIWTLFTGGMLWATESEKIWFAQRIVVVAPWTQITSWKEAATCLKRTVWADKLNGEACVALWECVEQNLGLQN